MRKLVFALLCVGLIVGVFFWLANGGPAEPEREEVRIELPDTFEK